MNLNKRIISLVLVVMMLAFLGTAYADPASGASQVDLRFIIGSSSYLVNGQATDMDTAPQIVESRTLLPIRYVATPLGATVNWDGTERKVTIELDGKKIEMWIGRVIALVDGRAVFIDPSNANVKPIIIDNRTMLPVRFVSENLGCTVGWDAQTQQVQVVSGGATIATDANSLEARYGAQLDYNLGDVKEDITATDRATCLELMATIDEQVKLRASQNEFYYNDVEYEARHQFNQILDDLTGLYYDAPDYEDSYYDDVEDSAETRILDSLRAVMSSEHYEDFLKDYNDYLDNLDNESYFKLFDNLDRYAKLNSALIVMLIDQYGTEQTKALYAIDDQFELLSQPIVNGGPAVATGRLDAASLQSLWQLVKSIIPAEDLKFFDYLLISSDGSYGNLASVIASPDDDGSGERWLIQVDDADLDYDLVATLIHEYAHYLTLNDEQVKYDDGFKPERYCEPGLIANDNAMLTDFYQRFWKNYLIEDAYQTSDLFYLRNQAAFVTWYAATNASEDIAESFSFFVLYDKPTGNSIADQKVRFFYDYPELVQLRQKIRQSLDDASGLIDSLTSSNGNGGVSYPFEGSIAEDRVIIDNSAVKVTFKEAYYSAYDNGLMAVLNVENKLNEEIGIGFSQVGINGIGFDPWQSDDFVSAGDTRVVNYKLVSTDNLKMAGIDTLGQLSLEAYYYPQSGNLEYLDKLELKNPANPNYQQTVDFSGKELLLNYGSGKLKMTFGIDKMIMDEEYGDAELYVLHENLADVPIVIYYEAIMNDGNNPELPYCGPILYGAERYMEALPFNGGDLEKCESVTIKNLYITDFNDVELFRLDELVIKKDDLTPLSY